MFWWPALFISYYSISLWWWGGGQEGGVRYYKYSFMNYDEHTKAMLIFTPEQRSYFYIQNYVFKFWCFFSPILLTNKLIVVKTETVRRLISNYDNIWIIYNWFKRTITGFYYWETNGFVYVDIRTKEADRLLKNKDNRLNHKYQRHLQ